MAESYPTTAPSTTALEAMRIPPDLRVAAAARLAGATHTDAARRLLAAASSHGLDFSNMWGTVEAGTNGLPARVRQVCLAVPGSGKTAMLILSGPGADGQGWLGDDRAQLAERARCVALACAELRALGRERGTPIAIAQALPDPSDTWAIDAFTAGGLSRIADLAYMRRPLPGPDVRDPDAGRPWPPDVTVRPVHGAAPGEPDHDLLIEALDRSYEDTLDCPGLCGLRRTADVLESHRATGRFDGRHWQLVLHEGQPHGCLLLTHCPDHNAIELVYVGLSKALRGRGLGRRLLVQGLSRVRALRADHVACAVDTRNTPALRLYERLFFTVAATRVALVKGLSR